MQLLRQLGMSEHAQGLVLDLMEPLTRGRLTLEAAVARVMDVLGRPGGKRPVPPIIAALDLNKDGIIDADEISKAPQSLLTLDKNGDGKLTEDEYRPKPPGGPGGPGGDQGGPGGKGGPGEFSMPPMPVEPRVRPSGPSTECQSRSKTTS